MSSDVKTLISLLQSNSSLMNKLKNVDNGKEINDFLTFILNNINNKPSGVQKSNLTALINKRFK